MITVGVVGGIASGKSTVVGRLRELGACSIDGDAIAHRVIEYPEVRDQLRARWRVNGDGLSEDDEVILGTKAGHAPRVLEGDGTVNRSAVAKIIFNMPAEYAFFSAVMGPLVEEAVEVSIKRYSGRYTSVLILDFPLLFEYGFHHRCKCYLFVDREHDARVRAYQKRLEKAGRLMTLGDAKDDLDSREANLFPMEEEKAACTHVIDNNGSFSRLHEQTKNLWEDWLIEAASAI